MYCPMCGKSISDKSRFCPYCGAKIRKIGLIEGLWLDRSKRKWLLAIGAGVIVLAVVLIIVLSSGGKNAENAELPESRAEESRAADKSSGGKAVAGLTETEPRKDAAGELPTAEPETVPVTEEPEAVLSSEDTAHVTVSGDEDPARTEDDTQTDDYTQTDAYQTAYRETWNSMEGIIADYWEGGDEIDRAIADLQGSTEKFYTALKRLDPEIYDYASESIALDHADSLLEYHLIDQGLSNTVFADNELGRQLRDIGERAFLGLLEGLVRIGDNGGNGSDVLIAVAVNGDYALVRTKGTVNTILYKMDVDSGYNLVKPALEDYRQKLEPLWNKVFEETMQSIDRQDAKQRAAADELDHTLRGIEAALDDYELQWDTERSAWTSAFFREVGMETKDVKTEDGEKYVYCIIDKDGKCYGRFLHGSVEEYDGGPSAWIGSDGLCKLSNPFRIRDISGEILFDKTGDGNYIFTGTGQVLLQTEKNDFDHGEYSVLELVSLDGTTQELMSGRILDQHDYYHPLDLETWYQSVDGSGIWYVEYVPLEMEEAVRVIVELDSGKVIPWEEWNEEHPYEEKKNYVSYRFIRLNDHYIFDTAEDEVYEHVTSETGIACGTGVDPEESNEVLESEKPVVKLDAGGGTKEIFYADGYYWVLSETGYYYVMNDTFDRIIEPVRISDKKSFYAFTPYGILLREESGELGQYDMEGQLVLTFPANYVYGFIGGRYAKDWGYYANPNRSDYDMSYNLNTRERMYLSFDAE